jgi:hypothetical protein
METLKLAKASLIKKDLKPLALVVQKLFTDEVKKKTHIRVFRETYKQNYHPSHTDTIQSSRCWIQV